ARMLRAERGGVAPTEVVLIAGRKEGPRPIDRKQEPGGKTDLGDLVDEDAFLGKLRANRVEKGDLRRKLFESSAHLGLPLLHFRAAGGTVVDRGGVPQGAPKRLGRPGR